jgi:hypothetical protein
VEQPLNATPPISVTPLGTNRYPLGGEEYPYKVMFAPNFENERPFSE